MKSLLIPVLSSALLTGSPLLAQEAAAPAQPPAAAPAGKAPSADSLMNQTLSFLIDIQQTLAAAQDKESADKAAKKLAVMQKDIRHFIKLTESLSEAEQEKAEALMEKMESRMERMVENCKKEGTRLKAAGYYDSATLKEILEDSDEFSDFIESDDDALLPPGTPDDAESDQ